MTLTISQLAPPVDRFWNRVDLTEPLDCWEWTGARIHGYGYFRIAGRMIRAHRFSFELHGGVIPEGLHLDHLCRNRACVRPDHLEVVTRAENIRRGRQANAEKTHCKHGHEFTEANTRITSAGIRQCRTCDRDRQRAYYRLKNEART